MAEFEAQLTANSVTRQIKKASIQDEFADLDANSDGFITLQEIDKDAV